MRGRASAVWSPLRRSVLSGLKAEEEGIAPLKEMREGETREGEKREGAKPRPTGKGYEKKEKPEGCLTVSLSPPPCPPCSSR